MAPERTGYWQSLAERDGDSELVQALDREFYTPPGEDEPGPNRRAFLKAAGFAFAGVWLSGCQRTPERVALPLVNQAPGQTPGRPLYYATTCGACSAGCGMLVKTVDGRPIKLEGNPDHPLSRGGLCAIGQASLLGLYDSQRLQQPLKNGERVTLAVADREIRDRLAALQPSASVRVLSRTINSPTIRAAIGAFLARFGDGKHVEYDPLSCSALLDAYQRTHGARLLPHFRLDRADVIVSFDADFLGTWISPVEFTTGYSARRVSELHESADSRDGPARLSFHVQFESRLSLTGSKADRRLCLTPGEIGVAMSHIADRLARRKNVPFSMEGVAASTVPPALLDEIAERLWQSQGRSLVLSGSQDVTQQVLCNFINDLLDNYGATLDLEHFSHQCQGNDAELATLLEDLRQNRVGALFVLDCNPVFELPDGDKLLAALRRVPLVVCCSERTDETNAAAGYVIPRPHFLASWGDAEPIGGHVSLFQPTLRPLGECRPILESLAVWLGTPQPALTQIQEYWRQHFFPRRTTAGTFWDRSLHDGYAVLLPASLSGENRFDRSHVRPVLQATSSTSGEFALLLYPKPAILDGRHAYNPWLQELPDPISKVTWDNYVALSPSAAATLDVRDGDVVRLEAGTEGNLTTLELPVLVQPGQHDRVVAVAVGYGSQATKRFANLGPQWIQAHSTVGPNGVVGINAAPLLSWMDNRMQYVGRSVRIAKTNRRHVLASTQTHHSLHVPENLAPQGQQRRPLILETTLAGFQSGWQATPVHPHSLDLWPEDHPADGEHRWGMAIDLQACTGCSACVVACQAENNIPVVGKDEVARHREMHWLRIDRYFSTPVAHAPGTSEVDVSYQPMLCQHCGNAPCETVCPVLATVHSSEGLNQQVYNRCVGTRYCANNCPYKVRRFNWFAYAHDDSLQNLALNPDVTVRSRGVMEKCSFCIQRIQEAKLEARRRGIPIADGAIQTACQQSCPAQAIVFGNLNDPNSKVAKLAHSRRAYKVLAELNVRPSVTYLGLVRNRPAEQRHEHDG